MNRFNLFLSLNTLVFIYSLSGLFSKIASNSIFFSFNFFLYYSLIILLLFIYAVFWQYIIKHIPLSTAFSYKSLTVVWGIIWGKLFFDEVISLEQILGAILVIFGVVIFSLSD
ncbi:EamA family transporter [Succinivibrio dextrinosolvens]|uniref:EamA family transporter n=1 Tax=Succinivibrio dextrinosolvens TaxID=83771 RepID=UPI00099DB220|nr:EamA family transporter [Succinivibrio dextrinosolvens]